MRCGSATVGAPMTPAIPPHERASYYVTALRLLRFAEQRSPTNRRFGVDADALWKSFAGGLKTTDRLDLLLRDADTEWPGAFGARAVFALRAVAEDDAFGAQWSSLAPVDAERIWKDAMRSDVAASVEAAIDQLGEQWELRRAEVMLPRFTAGSRLAVGGAGAIAAAILAFAGNPDLTWSQQVTVFADRPGERQLAASAAMLLNTTRASQLRGTDEKTPPLTGHAAVVSDDATDEVRAAITEQPT